MLCLTPAPPLAGSHPAPGSERPLCKYTQYFLINPHSALSSWAGEALRSEPGWVRGLSLAGASGRFHLLQNVNDFRGQEVGGWLIRGGGGAPFCVCFCFAVACQRSVPLAVFSWPMLSVAETTTHDLGMLGPNSDISIGIDFCETSEVVAGGAVIALPESQTRNLL